IVPRRGGMAWNSTSPTQRRIRPGAHSSMALSNDPNNDPSRARLHDDDRCSIDLLSGDRLHSSAMPKQTSHILALARKGAEHRYEALKAEIAALVKGFPHLRARVPPTRTDVATAPAATIDRKPR